MKILSIVWYKVLPAKFGGQKGIACFNKHLSEHFPVVCLCSSNNVPGDLPYTLLPSLPVSKRQFASPSCSKMIRQVAMREKPTHIILEHPYHGIAAAKACSATGAQLIVHSHNIESERFRQMGKWWWRVLWQYEKWIHRKADLSLFKTEADMGYAMRRFGLPAEKCLLVPYGADTKAVRPDRAEARSLIVRRHGLATGQPLLLFAATLDYAPNAAALEKIYHEVAPGLANETVIVCGRIKSKKYACLHRLSHPNVVHAGEVDDIENYFAAADVFINPVQTGGGIQTKTIDALAAGLNVVCFAGMTDKTLASAAGDAMTAVPNGNWPAFIHALRQVAADKRPVPPSFPAHYDWQKIIAPLVERIAG